MRNLFIILISLMVRQVSCRSHRENIMFSVPEDYQSILDDADLSNEQELKISVYDELEIRVVSKAGEGLITDGTIQNAQPETAEEQGKQLYTVNGDGMVNLPMVGNVDVEGRTVSEAENIIADLFSAKIDQPFVQVRNTSKRVYLLGPEEGKVIRISRENTPLSEILAEGGGLGANGHASNIRIIRKDKVMVLDLSKLENARLIYTPVLPEDVIYIEPVRRPVAESIREYGQLVGIITALVSVTSLIISVTR